MKERAIVGFNFPSERWPQARELFRRIGRDDLAHRPKEKFGYDLIFDDPEDLERFYRAARELGFGDKPGFVRRQRLYTPEELQSAALLCLGVTTAPRGNGGPTYGTEYDLSRACRLCGTGAVQISPLVVKASDLPRRTSVFQTLDVEVLVSAAVADELEDAALTGLELRQAVSLDNGGALPWWQLIAQEELPPMDPSTGGILRSEHDRPCRLCGRDGFFRTPAEPTEIRYRDLAPGALPDVVRTWEHFGVGRIVEPFKNSQLAHPLLLVRPIVLDIFRQKRARNVEFTPVQFIGAGDGD
jgi:hypothetical protein